MTQLRLGEMELMIDSVEEEFGAPSALPKDILSGRPMVGSKGNMMKETMDAYKRWVASPAAKKAREDVIAWRKQAPVGRYKEVRHKFERAGIALPLLVFIMPSDITDDEIEYGFEAAQALGVRAITSSTQVSVAKRVAPFADKHKLMVGFHGHDETDNPDALSTPESFAQAMSYSKYHMVNLDIGHFTAADGDPVAYIREHHARITNVHLKDRKKNHGPNVAWGTGDTPIKPVLQLLKHEKYPFPANIEYEYASEKPADFEVAACLDYCKQALA